MLFQIFSSGPKTNKQLVSDGACKPIEERYHTEANKVPGARLPDFEPLRNKNLDYCAKGLPIPSKWDEIKAAAKKFDVRTVLETLAK